MRNDTGANTGMGVGGGGACSHAESHLRRLLQIQRFERRTCLCQDCEIAQHCVYLCAVDLCVQHGPRLPRVTQHVLSRVSRHAGEFQDGLL